MPMNRSDPEITAAQIRAQRDRILASRVFSRSKRQSAFLDHVINAALEGQTDRLKEFTLGVAVFDKDESFDPNTDSIVRVEASRLRAKLREYYAEEGAGDSVRIDIPKGHYAPAFRLSEVAKTEPSTPLQKAHLWLGVAVATLVIALVFTYVIYEMPRRVSIEETPQLPQM